MLSCLHVATLTRSLFNACLCAMAATVVVCGMKELVNHSSATWMVVQCMMVAGVCITGICVISAARCSPPVPVAESFEIMEHEPASSFNISIWANFIDPEEATTESATRRISQSGSMRYNEEHGLKCA
jgi:hypothetical protein